MKKKLLDWLSRIALPFAKAGIKRLICNELIKLGEKASGLIHDQGIVAFNSLFDRLQAKIRSVLDSSLVRRLLPDSLEEQIKKIVQTGGDKIQDRINNAVAEKSQTGIKLILTEAAELMCREIDEIKL